LGQVYRDVGKQQRSRRDSNPRGLSTQRFSRPSPATIQTLAQPPLTEKEKNDLAESLAFFPDLAEVISLWRYAPIDVRRGIVRKLRASAKREDR
jgi:hypothetical protein